MNKTLVKILSCFIPDKQKRHLFIVQHDNYVTKYGNKEIISGEISQEKIAEKLKSDAPCLICRFGLNEFKTMEMYLKKGKISKKRIEIMKGIFPVSNETLVKFSKEMLSIVPNIDILAAWAVANEERFCKKYCPQNIEYVEFNALTSITYQNPWTSALKGKKVLVINPFENSIKEQYAKKDSLFENKETLPDFDLITYKPVYVTADNIDECPYNSWFDALESMKNDIKNIDFDVAIIGAGAFGIFLADYCKQLGKKAVHVGGATQILFGIVGQRWIDYYPKVNAMINEHWVRPKDSEKPKHYKKVENGCYW